MYCTFLFSEGNGLVTVRVAPPGLGTRRRVVVAIEHDDKVFSLIRSALTGLGSGLEVQRVTNGLDALRLFRKVSPYERAETPRLVIIDTASFVQDAGPSLVELQREVQLRSFPAVVIGTEPAAHYGMKASLLGGQLYISRSVDCEAFREQLKEASLFSLWLFDLEDLRSRMQPESRDVADERFMWLRNLGES
jgi:hypothetical protein